MRPTSRSARSCRVWVTERGRACDALLAPGRRYRVRGDGLVLVGAETYVSGGAGTEVALRPAPQAGTR